LLYTLFFLNFRVKIKLTSLLLTKFPIIFIVFVTFPFLLQPGLCIGTQNRKNLAPGTHDPSWRPHELLEALQQVHQRPQSPRVRASSRGRPIQRAQELNRLQLVHLERLIARGLHQPIRPVQDSLSNPQPDRRTERARQHDQPNAELSTKNEASEGAIQHRQNTNQVLPGRLKHHEGRPVPHRRQLGPPQVAGLVPGQKPPRRSAKCLLCDQRP